MATEVLVDWLDCTYPPDEWPESQVVAVLNAALFSVSDHGADPPDPERVRWLAPGGGVLVVQVRRRWARVSASGQALRHLRDFGFFHAYVQALAEGPYRITRIDLAYDVPKDAPAILAALWKRFPASCPLTRKAVPTSWYSRTRPDGLRSGTFYVGHRDTGAATARVYDKQVELLERSGVVSGPMTRYEVTAKRGQYATLADALAPVPLFWHLAAPALLARPPGVPDWLRGDPSTLGWTMDTISLTAFQRMERRIEHSPELAALAQLAAESSPHALPMLRRLVLARLDYEFSAALASAAPDASQEPLAALG